MLEEALGCQNLARMEHEVAEERELLGRQVETLLVAVGLVPRRVEPEAPESHRRPTIDRRAAGKGANPCRELGEAERLDQVVVRTVVQTAHSIVETVPGGQHQDARWRGVR